MKLQNEYSTTSLQQIVKVSRVKINLGSNPEFVKGNEYVVSSGKVRSIKYSPDKMVTNFPLIISQARLTDAIEMNLFLIHRYLGQVHRKGNSINVEAISLETISDLAKHLVDFLRWLYVENINWEESLTEPLNERISNLDTLPIWRYRDSLIKKIEVRTLSYNYAQNRLRVVREFYEWAWKNNRIQVVPFQYITIFAKRKNKTIDKYNNSLGSLLFGMGSGPTRNKGIPLFTTNLLIPKRVKQKDTSPEDGLQPYSIEELKSLINSDVMRKENHQLWVELGYRCGLRAMDIRLLNYKDIHNPEIGLEKAFKITLFESKGKK